MVLGLLVGGPWYHAMNEHPMNDPASLFSALNLSTHYHITLSTHYHNDQFRVVVMRTAWLSDSGCAIVRMAADSVPSNTACSARTT